MLRFSKPFIGSQRTYPHRFCLVHSHLDRDESNISLEMVNFKFIDIQISNSGSSFLSLIAVWFWICSIPLGDITEGWTEPDFRLRSPIKRYTRSKIVSFFTILTNNMNLITSMSLSWMFWKMFCFAKTIKLPWCFKPSTSSQRTSAPLFCSSSSCLDHPGSGISSPMVSFEAVGDHCRSKSTLLSIIIWDYYWRSRMVAGPCSWKHNSTSKY